MSSLMSPCNVSSDQVLSTLAPLVVLRVMVSGLISSEKTLLVLKNNTFVISKQMVRFLFGQLLIFITELLKFIVLVKLLTLSLIVHLIQQGLTRRMIYQRLMQLQRLHLLLVLGITLVIIRTTTFRY